MNTVLRRTAGSGTRRTALAGVTALATALLAVTLPGPHTAVATTAAPPLAGWEAITDADGNKILAPGVEHFRYRETTPPPGDLRHGKPRRELNVLRIDPAKGALRIESSYGRAAGDAEIVRDQLNRNKNLPVAGINGSFFSPEGRHAQAAAGEEESVQSYGATVRDGVLLGAACNPDKASRRSLVLQYGIPYITEVSTSMAVTSDRAPAAGGPVRQVVDDVNRNPGGALACPRDETDGVGDKDPNDPNDAEGRKYTDSEGRSMTAYQDPTEFVLFNDRYGMKTPKPDLNPAIGSDNSAGFEVVIEPDGALTRPPTWSTVRGGKDVPKGKHVLQVVGTQPTAWLKEMYAAGAKLTLEQKVTDTFDGRDIPLDESVDIVSGGHRLIMNGVNKFPGNRDGQGNPTSCARLVSQGEQIICKDSRTVVGVDDRGRTVLATLTGPRDENPVTGEADIAVYDGGFFADVTRPLAELGVMDAINLDGGGSTTLLIRQKNDDPADTAANYRRYSGLTDLKHRPVFDTVYVGLGGGLVTPGG
ncbi:phosphodiester glycosidase family protein [Streptomyces sp. NPDC012950]|uniref:phosphodiester glycosidase family protein n=1 Tax=Streptomyces sp. NPDC012950 TaxID=3364858 RepID=UPI0036905010